MAALLLRGKFLLRMARKTAWIADEHFLQVFNEIFLNTVTWLYIRTLET